MSVHGLTLALLCLSPLWILLTLVSSHPQLSPCLLIQRTALCNNANVSSVPSGLPGNTEDLQLNNNHLETLQDNSLLLYPALITLSLACNSLTELGSNTFQNSRALTSLNLANNRIHVGVFQTSLALKKLPHLRALDLSENKLEDDMVTTLLQNLTSLEYLNLSGNLLMRLDESSFSDLHHLRELDLQRNVIFEIDNAFQSNTKLQRLNLAFNSLPCLTDFRMTQLLVLNASHNFIEWFISRQDLDDMFQLETLDLTHNKLLFFPFLPSRSNLRNLYLAHNSLRFYENLADTAKNPNLTTTVQFYNLNNSTGNVTAQLWNDSMHGDVSSLEILDLRGNQVQYFPEGFIKKMSALTRLQVRKNCLESLNLTAEGFSGRLYELDISDNMLNQISADANTLALLSNLTYVNLSHNSLEWLPSRLFSSLPSLRLVDLSYNDIDICFSDNGEIKPDAFSSCVSWRDVAYLEQLYLKGCNLNVIPPLAFSGLSLTHLELSDNPGLKVQQSIRDLDGTLQHLGLGNTQIHNLDFSHFKHLRFLNISRNNLTRLPSSLQNLDLRVLDIRDNRLSSIPTGLANALAPKLQFVFLAGNPFSCCQTEWFRTFESTKTMTMVEQSDIKCEDLLLTTHRLRYLNASVCLDDSGEHIFWYIVLFLPICLSLAGILCVFLHSFKPRTLHKSIKKKCLKRSSY